MIIIYFLVIYKSATNQYKFLQLSNKILQQQHEPQHQISKMTQITKIIVTGGAGFVGSHLVEQLSKNKNLQVYSLDDYSSGVKQNHVKNVRYINGNTRDIEKLVDFVPAIIYHLGEYSRTSASFQDPNFVWEQNCHGTFKIVEFCRKNKVRLLYAASSTKMADNGQGKNQSPYSWSKATNVDLVNRYGQWFNLDYCIVYFYNVYGGRQVRFGQYATLIAIWKQCIKQNRKLPLVLPGTQVRIFTYIEDIVSGIIQAGKKAKGDGYCLGAEQSYSLWQVAQLFGKTKQQEFQLLPAKPGDRKMTSIDLTSTKVNLNWSAKTKLKDHIQKFLQQIKKNQFNKQQ